MDRNILRQYLSGLAGANNRFLLENSRALGNLPQNIVYNGLVYTLNLRENAFINQFGHRIDPSAAPAFITEARAFEQQNLAILDISASSSDSSSSRPTPSPIVVAAIQDFGAIPDPKDPTEGTLLSWIIDENQTDNVDEFEVLRSTSIGGPFVSVAIVTIKGARAFEDTKLDPDTTYYYQIRAIYKEQPGALSPTVSIKTETVKPTPVGITAPSGLTALNITQNSLNLRWTDNSTNELGFFVEQSLNGSTYALLEAVGVGITFAGVVGLTQDQNYWFRVQAYATGSTSAYSNVVNIRTLPTIPAAPTGLSLLVGGTSQIALSWTDNATNEQYFNVFQTTDGGSSYVLGTTLGANSTAYIATGLCAGTTYGFRVNAGNTGGTSGFAGPEFATTIPNAPAAPSNLRFTLITAGRMDFIWDDNSTNETGFLVQSSTGGVSYSDLETTAANINEYSARGLNSGTTYFFRVAAFNSGGTSAFSGATSAQTLQTAPSAPSSLVAYTSVPETKNYLRYTQGFTTSVSTANGGWTSTTGSSTSVIADNSITAPDGSIGAALLRINSATIIGGIHSIVNEPGVTANDLWTGSVWLRGNTSTSGSINVVARKGSSQIVIPSTIKILSGPGTVIPGATGEPHWNGVTGLSKTEWTRIAWNNITGWGPTGFTDVLLRLTVNFYSGTNPSAVTGDSIYVWGAQFERNPYPTAYLAATGGSFSTRAFQGFTSQANLYWTDNSTNESGFLIERSTNDVTYAGVTSVAANTTIYGDNGLSAGSTYFYRVSAFNAGGTSATTKSPAAATFPNPPATPSFTSITGTTNSITLNWNNVANETGYGLYRSETLAGTYTGITTLGANVTTFVNTGLSSGTTFFYKIDAFNSGGTSALSGATSFVTLSAGTTPSAPTGFTATSAGANSVTLQWTDTATNEDGFLIYYRGIT
jgi:hypothetical protein